MTSNAVGVWLRHSTETTPNLECLPFTQAFVLSNQSDCSFAPMVNQSQPLLDLCHQNCLVAKQHPRGETATRGPVVTATPPATCTLLLKLSTFSDHLKRGA